MLMLLMLPLYYLMFVSEQLFNSSRILLFYNYYLQLISYIFCSM